MKKTGENKEKPAKSKKASQNRAYKQSSRMQQFKELQELTGINSRTLSSYSKDGCNVLDLDELRTYLDKLPNRPSTIKTSFYTAPGSVADQGIELTEDINVETLKKELLLSKDKHEIARIKTQIEALKVAQQLEILNRSHISIIDAEALFVKIGAILKSQLMKLEADLPGQLYGMTQASMKTRIGDYIRKLLNEFNSTDRFWNEEVDIGDE